MSTESKAVYQVVVDISVSSRRGASSKVCFACNQFNKESDYPVLFDDNLLSTNFRHRPVEEEWITPIKEVQSEDHDLTLSSQWPWDSLILENGILYRGMMRVQENHHGYRM